MIARFVATLLAVGAASCAGPAALAGGGPQNVAVIVNPNDPDSLAVANAYVELRGIPECNVVYAAMPLDLRATTALQFRDRIFNPVIAELKRRQLTEQIDCLAFSSGYPYLIDCTPLFPGKEFPREARPMTSLTSAAFLNQFVLESRAEMFVAQVNAYFAPTENGKTTSRAFSAAQGWAPGGAPAQGGFKYLLATALGVTHGHGNSVSEIIDCLRRAKAADGTRPKGTVYYMQNRDIRSQVRQDAYPAAVAELAAAGVKGVILPGVAPQDKQDVAGLTTGSANVSLRSSGSTLLPGALVDNLTSAGGQMLIRQETRPQTRISEYIRLGAAGASGTVVEPFAIPAKFPSPALHVHYARGCSLAEAFYLSVAAPCHLLIIGDPLCQPWAAPPAVSVSGLPDNRIVSGVVRFTPQAKYADTRKARRFELFVDGLRDQAIDAGGQFIWGTKKLADGWHEVRVVAIDDTPIAVQGAWVETVQVKNGDDAVQLSIAEPQRTPEAGEITVEATSTAKGELRIMHNGRRLATIAGGSGRAQIEAKLLGKGRVRLYAEQDGQPPLRSRSVVIEVY